jgi:hypothetical protein
MEFETDEQMRKYLKEHPDADRRLHRVKRQEMKTPRVEKPVSQLKREVEQAKGAAERQWAQDSKELEAHLKPIARMTVKVAAVLPRAAKIVDNRKRREFLRGRKEIQAIAERYGMDVADVAGIVDEFAKKGGGGDTKVKLDVRLERRVKNDYIVRSLAKLRVPEIPEQLYKFLPSTATFRVDAKGATRIIERFGNKYKTVETKVKTQNLLLRVKGKIGEQVKKDLKGKDERKRLTALVVGIGMETGIRPSSEETGITVTDKDTGLKTFVPTYGASTIRKEHVTILRSNLARLEFPGKKGTINVAEINDQELVEAIKKLVDEPPSDGPLIATHDGVPIGDSELNSYLEPYGVTFTDFRKYRGTAEVYESLRDNLQEIYEGLVRAAEENREKAEEKAVEVLMQTLEKVYESARAKLSHKDVAETIDSYVNPMVILNFLRTGVIADEFEDAIEYGGAVGMNFAAMLEQARRATGAVASMLIAEEKKRASKFEELENRIRDLMRSMEVVRSGKVVQKVRGEDAGERKASVVFRENISGMSDRVASNHVSGLLNDYGISRKIAAEVLLKFDFRGLLRAIKKRDMDFLEKYSKKQDVISGHLADYAPAQALKEHPSLQDIGLRITLDNKGDPYYWSDASYTPSENFVSIVFFAGTPKMVVRYSPSQSDRLSVDISRFHATIRHEVTHALRDNKTRHIGKFTERMMKDKSVAESYMQLPNEFEFEIDAVIHALAVLRRKMGKKKWDALSIDGLLLSHPSFAVKKMLTGNKGKAYLRRLIREGLLGKTMLEEARGMRIGSEEITARSVSAMPHVIYNEAGDEKAADCFIERYGTGALPKRYEQFLERWFKTRDKRKMMRQSLTDNIVPVLDEKGKMLLIDKRKEQVIRRVK